MTDDTDGDADEHEGSDRRDDDATAEGSGSDVHAGTDSAADSAESAAQQPSSDDPEALFGPDPSDGSDHANPFSTGLGDPPTEAESDDSRDTGTAANAQEAEPEGSTGRPDAPLGDLAASLESRSDPTDVDDGLFTQEDVDPVDAEVVWEQLEGTADPEVDVQEEHVVEKKSYCESCPFFSEPPDVQCTHPGSQILALVDVDHFRVAGCPKVAETEELERL